MTTSDDHFDRSVVADRMRAFFRAWTPPDPARTMTPLDRSEAGGSIGSVPERLLSYADLESFPDDGLRRELIGGQLFVTPSPFTRHQAIVFRLNGLFYAHLMQAGGGQAFPAPLDVVLSDHDVVEPDVVFVADSDAEAVGVKNVTGVPSLVIEVLSDARRDRVLKRDLYERFGVPEYWIVDGEADRVEVYRNENGRYGKPKIFEPGDTLTLESLPGFSIDVATLLAR
jgi:Uma2 family endonuclease